MNDENRKIFNGKIKTNKKIVSRSYKIDKRDKEEKESVRE